MAKKKKVTTSKIHEKQKSSGFNLSDQQQFGLSVLFIAIVLLAYFYPIVFEGKQPQASDYLAWKGNSQSIVEAREETDSNPLWAHNVFGGMPAYLISFQAPFEQPARYVLTLLGKILDWRVVYYLLAAVGMLLLMQFWKSSNLSATFAALAYILWPHLTGLLEAGHNTKFRVIMLLPLIIWTFLRLISKANLLNFSLFAIAFSLGVQGRHYQIMFYICIALFIIGVVELIHLIRQKETKQLGIKILMVVIGISLAAGIAAFPVLSVQEYAKYSTRGGSGNEKSSGLGYDYATGWSLHPAELMDLIIPRFHGGNSTEKYRGNAVHQLQGQNIPGYWGTKLFTSSTDYIGIVTVFFAIIAAVFLFRDRHIYALLVICVLSILIAFGKYFSPVFNLFFNFVPFFNKFRVPIMILVLVQFGLAVLAGFGLEFIISSIKELKDRGKAIKKIAIVFGVLFVIGGLPLLLQGSFALAKPEELTRYQPDILALLKEARFDLLQQDALRMLLLLAASFALVFAYLKGKISDVLFGGLLIGILLFDLLGINNRYLTNLVAPQNVERHFAQTATDQFLENDTTLFRIFPIGNLYGDSRWSYRHQSIGGYHPAKLQLIQDINEKCLYNGNAAGFNNPASFPINWNVVNMLNTKYILAQGEINHPNLLQRFTDPTNNIVVYENTNRSPRVFPVGNVEIITDVAKRYARLNDPNFNPDSTAILEQDLKTALSMPEKFSYKITQYEPNVIDITAETDRQTLLVLSEIYYPAGWKAFIDNSETDIFKTNHLLRSIVVPEGKHLVSFRFEPESYYSSLWISGISTFITYLMLGVFFVRHLT